MPCKEVVNQDRADLDDFGQTYVLLMSASLLHKVEYGNFTSLEWPLSPAPASPALMSTSELVIGGDRDPRKVTLHLMH